MQTYTVIAALLLVILVHTPAKADDPGKFTRVVHDELTQAWDDLSRHLHGLGDRWRDHFSRTEARPESDRPLITLMLRHRDELKLSSDQVRNLERLRNEFQRESIRRQADIRIAENNLVDLLEAETVELEKVETTVRDIERLKADLRLARIRAIEKGKSQLTSEQRKKLQVLLGELQFTRSPVSRASRRSAIGRLLDTC